MKIRKDFVSNSSSSSFIIGFNSDNFENEFLEFCKQYNIYFSKNLIIKNTKDCFETLENVQKNLENNDYYFIDNCVFNEKENSDADIIEYNDINDIKNRLDFCENNCPYIKSCKLDFYSYYNFIKNFYKNYLKTNNLNKRYLEFDISENGNGKISGDEEDLHFCDKLVGYLSKH